MSLWRTKSVEASIADTEEPEHALKKGLGALDLVVFGVGVSVGAGIFVLTGQAAAAYAGPAVALSFVIAAVACALAAVCYAEFASTVPVAGSAYTFSFATLGELVAWTIGWDLVLEFVVGAAAVSTSFSAYLQVVLGQVGITLPTAMTGVEEGVVNLPAALLVLALTAVIATGIRLSSRLNQVLTAIKVAVVLLVIVVGAFYVSAANWSPFVPPSQGTGGSGGSEESALTAPLVQTLFGLEPSVFGMGGVVAAAALVFFAFIGFDVVATTAEETRRPQRDVPIGILGSLAVVTVLYVAVSLIVTGVRPYTEIDPDDGAPLATAFTAIGVGWMGSVVAIGACLGLIAVTMILIIGQTRVAFAMARDGLLPRSLARTDPRTGTPVRITVITGAVIAVLAAFVPLSELSLLVNIGTLFAFILVSVGVVVLRRTRPDLRRSFRVPAVGVVATLSVLACSYLMLNLTLETWLRFVVWMALGYVVYFAYARRHSVLARHPERTGTSTPDERTRR
ncbi:amino acid/polyamine/organocation transporter, APC superfamily [Quadrisphaera granulorum]|uniref:Amino acid/polyamine/organocation transporter (APC superfamily) n=1 Tax=Quadrisphaera granulorum TaxID=317664 RepID=A0A315ZVG2_9ACTN|nr:amino acid permease [Quadrisphaera granulorum]PWJ49299.1 amino acid/polyamine/organocation transporter (APC superfamily) [Quadrisphaera granulorum]SZE98216.1 amino acid/polyamine/organocation transporter, APC superfamily [Quadrisphaera granulorum]